MKFATYLSVSVIAAISLVVYAIYTKEQFYPVILFLVSSKVSFVININMMLACAILVAKFIFYSFFGNLRDVEVEMLIDRAKFTITETLLALTIFRNEFTYSVIMFFILLLFIKSFHWLAKSRIDYLDQVMPASKWVHIRIGSFLLCLAIVDTFATYSCIQYTLKHGRSSMILFGFEFGLLCISVINIITRHGLLICDQNFTDGVISKGFYVMIIDLVCDGFRFLIYICFFGLIFQYYGLPIHILREVYVAFQVFQRKFLGFIKYLNLSKNLDIALQSPNEEELRLAGDCLICREPMIAGKKLPLCGHVFHLECLRMWLQHQQSCPLCRADIPLQSPPSHTTATPPAAAAARVAVMTPANPPGAQNGVVSTVSTSATTVIRSKEDIERMNKHRDHMMKLYRRQKELFSPAVAAAEAATELRMKMHSNCIIPPESTTTIPTTSNNDNNSSSNGSSSSSISTSLSSTSNVKEETKSSLTVDSSLISSSSSSSSTVATAVDSTGREGAEEKLSDEAARRLQVQKQRSAYYEKISTSSSSSLSSSSSSSSLVEQAAAPPPINTFFKPPSSSSIATSSSASSYMAPSLSSMAPPSSSSVPIQSLPRKLPFSPTARAATANSSCSSSSVMNMNSNSSSSNSSSSNMNNIAASIKHTSSKLPAFYYISNGSYDPSIEDQLLPETTTSSSSSSVTSAFAAATDTIVNDSLKMTAAVYKEAFYGSIIIRQLKKGTIVFVFERFMDNMTGDTWLRMSDGWIVESCLMDCSDNYTDMNMSINKINLIINKNANTKTNTDKQDDDDDDDDEQGEGEVEKGSRMNSSILPKNQSSDRNHTIYFVLPYLPGCPAYVAMKKKLTDTKTMLFDQVDELVPRAADVSYDYMAVLTKTTNQQQPSLQPSSSSSSSLKVEEDEEECSLSPKFQRVYDNYLRMKGSIHYPSQQHNDDDDDDDQVRAAARRGSSSYSNYTSNHHHHHFNDSNPSSSSSSSSIMKNQAVMNNKSLRGDHIHSVTTGLTQTPLIPLQRHPPSHRESLGQMQQQMMMMNEQMIRMQQTFDNLQSLCRAIIDDAHHYHDDDDDDDESRVNTHNTHHHDEMIHDKVDTVDQKGERHENEDDSKNSIGNNSSNNKNSSSSSSNGGSSNNSGCSNNSTAGIPIIITAKVDDDINDDFTKEEEEEEEGGGSVAIMRSESVALNELNDGGNDATSFSVAATATSSTTASTDTITTPTTATTSTDNTSTDTTATPSVVFQDKEDRLNHNGNDTASL